MVLPVHAVEIRESERVVTAILNRPEKLNAIDQDMIEGLTAALDLAETRGAHVFLVRGAGGTFSAGADLEYLRSVIRDEQLIASFMARLGAVLERVEAAPFVSLAVVEGYAVAGGCELALACDIVIAVCDARIGDRHAEYALAPAAGGSVRLVNGLPKARANYLLLTGDLLTGKHAAEWGLVTLAAESSHLGEVVDEMIERLTARSREALSTAKAMIQAVRGLPRAEALQLERRLFSRHATTSGDVMEGLIAFSQGRRPVF